MTIKLPPDTIWVDSRVAMEFRTEPDQSNDFSRQTCYKRIDVFQEMLKESEAKIDRLGLLLADALNEKQQRPTEVVVQMVVKTYTGNDGDQYPMVLVLTNAGRMFEEIAPGHWSAYRGPEL